MDCCFAQEVCLEMPVTELCAFLRKADAYVMYRLLDRDLEAFELHMMACAECLEHVEFVQVLLGKLRETPLSDCAALHQQPPSVDAVMVADEHGIRTAHAS